jgi:eukaryotic-like serine/threonine-protein kinase
VHVDPDATLDYHSTASRGEGGIRGTPAYMSPEQAGGGLPTSASDVFAFGLIWYEMLTGRPALSAGSVLGLLRRLRTEDLGPGLAAEVDPQDRPLLAEMLQREPSRRPAMGEVLKRFTTARPAGDFVPAEPLITGGRC